MIFLPENFRGPTKVFLCIILIAVCMVRITTSGKKVRSLSESVQYKNEDINLNTQIEENIENKNLSKSYKEEKSDPLELFKKRKSILKNGCSQLEKIQGFYVKFIIKLYILCYIICIYFKK